MANKEVENITDFFAKTGTELTPEKKWGVVFESWVNKIEEKNLIPNLFELKLWLESLEEFFTSPYLEKLIFKYESTSSRNYEFYVFIFSQVIGKIISHLKTLDFKKDKYLLNFEEFIVENILESYNANYIPFIDSIYSSDSWFYSFRIFLQNLRNLSGEIVKNNEVTHKALSSLKKLYHKELMGNSILITLLKKRFIPKMDKIYQQEISNVISSIKDKELKRQIGIFFIFSYRILKINGFIEQNLNKSRHIDVTIPLIVYLKRKVDNLNHFYEVMLKKTLQTTVFSEDKVSVVDSLFETLQLEYCKIYEGEFISYFEDTSEKINRRKLLKNIILISDLALQELIEQTLKLFKPEISGTKIFENYISREQKSIELKKKLVKLHTKINDYFATDSKLSSADIFYDLNLFMETDFNYLMYKDWKDFLNYYNNLIRTDLSTEFKINLRSFHSFITSILKSIVTNVGKKGTA